MKRFSLMMSILALAVSCTQDRVCCVVNRTPEIFPDYIGVTVPQNVSPMNFCVLESGKFRLEVSDGNESFSIKGQKGGNFNIPARKWKRLLACKEEKDIVFSIFRLEKKGMTAYEPFSVRVSPLKADPYIAYRLIPPGYVAWKKMGIYQRCIENFRQQEIISNHRTDGNCVNCHSFCRQNPDTMLFHVRAAHAGTVIVMDDSAEKLDTKTDETISPFVYPSWHPSGRYVAFSNNLTRQSFFINHPNRVEVFDNSSDIVIYDVLRHTAFSCGQLKSKDAFQTFPTFSADGKRLYYCTAEAVDSVREHYSDIKYNLCSIAFNPSEGKFGDVVDTLVNARLCGKSVSFPRISPDGKFLVFTLHSFGNFSIWHHDADLWCLDLSSSRLWPMEKANSNDTESFHSWSSNGRWLVFSSRRTDGLYTRLYFSFVDENGNASKPFLLPQRNPYKYYEDLEYSFNIPEFITGRLENPARKLSSIVKNSELIQINFINNP